MTLVDGRYRVVRELGRGVMGTVYLAIDEDLDRKVALKMIAPEVFVLGDFAARFKREAAALAKVRHDNVVQVYALGHHEVTPFFAMEYVEGKTLDTLVSEHTEHLTYVPLRRALSILRQIAEGLTAVHLAGLVHRDVKPANIVIEESTGRPVLVDFGLVRKIESSSPDRKRLPAMRTKGLGTPAYAAPEQVGDTEVDVTHITPRADVYAFGCTAFELLTSETPFTSDDLYEILAQHRAQPAPKPSSRRPELAPFDPIFRRALAKDPNARYESATAFAEALLGASPDGPLPFEGEAASLRAGTTRVLVVDRDADAAHALADMMRQYFKGKPVTFVFASTASEALGQARMFEPHLVFFEDELEGIALLSDLRDLRRGSTMRAVATGVDVQRWRYGVLGVREILSKPLLASDVHESLKRLGL